MIGNAPELLHGSLIGYFRMKKFILIISLIMLSSIVSDDLLALTNGVRIKELCRLSNARDNALVGYGLVTGLARTGDSARSFAALQSLSNVLRRFGVQISAKQLRSRNTATVILTSILPPYLRPGDKIDVNVTSIGDARSLVGGTLMLTHLTGPDGKIYALAQGPVSVGGFTYDLNGNMVQKNHPTSATIPNGAIIERAVPSSILTDSGGLEFVLFEPDFTTANRMASNLNKKFKQNIAHAIDASRIEVLVPVSNQNNIVDFLTKIEGIKINPDNRARIIINERTGTVVAGGDVNLSKVSITHGDLKVAITTDYLVSQPIFVRHTGDGVKTQVIPRTSIDVEEAGAISISLPEGTSVADLVMALNKVNATSRDIITIIQAIKRAGALHAELIIQ